MTLYLLQFNAYSNRTIKGYATINQYSDYIVSQHNDINFGPNDGVSTSIILNTAETPADYLIAVEDGAIAHRWFIMSNSRTRQGQYKYELRRDLVYDYLEQVVHSTAYITKGWVNINDSAIYNQEQLPVNQIKKGEMLLQDVTRTPWIVGYLGKTDEATTVSRKNVYPEAVAVTEAVFDRLNTPTPIPDRIAYDLFNYHLQTSGRRIGGGYYVINFNKTGRLPVSHVSVTLGAWSTQGDIQGVVNENDLLALSDDLSTLNTEDATLAEIMAEWTYTYSDYEQYRNKVISYNGKYYKCTFNSGLTPATKTLGESSLTRISLYNALRSNALVTNKPQLVADVPVSIDYQIVMYTPRLEEIVNEYTATIPATANRVNLNNQPYSMFAMPYYDYNAGGSGGAYYELQGQASLSIAQAISEQWSGSNTLYDLQLVPYCPIQQYVEVYELTSFIWLPDMPVGSYTPITHTSDGTTETVGYIFWCSDDSFTFDIPVEYDLPTDPIDFKVDVQSLNWRLCSPNYSGAFDFNPAKNRGVSKINVDCTYKPYSPYIHLNPDFGGLYGQDYNDARGLICGGDFSLPQVNDAWQTYQIQNKNYANSFEREVQSIELQNKYARINDIVSAEVGTGTGLAAGAASGGMLGGLVGATAGTIVGYGASLAGGLADIHINQKLREEQLSLKKDLWNYSLQNIQALPQTLSKVGALNANNKLFPFIEVYDCTEEEKEAIRNKIIYNGMTINRIGQILDFMSEDRFLQCTLIRTDIHDEWNVIRNIKDELEMGVYL